MKTTAKKGAVLESYGLSFCNCSCFCSCGVSSKCQACFKDVSGIFQGHLKRFQGYFKGISKFFKMFQRCFKCSDGVSRLLCFDSLLLHGNHRSYPSQGVACFAICN